MDFELNLHSEPASAAYPAEPLVVEPDTSTADVLALLKAQRAGSELVYRDAALEGIFTERDALRLMAEGADMSQPIERVMIRRPVTIGADATVADAIELMSSGDYRHLPIVDAQGQPRGVLKATGIVHYLVEHFPQTVYNLPPEPGAVLQEREGA